MTKEDVMKKIRLIGSKEYRDGSSLHAGCTYQPIPFEEFKDVPCHMPQVAKFHMDLNKLLDAFKIEPRSVIDFGSNIGHHTFKFEQRFDADCIGIEADVFNYDAAVELAKFKGMKSKFFNMRAQDWIKDTDMKFDLCVFLNSHMWIHKQSEAEAGNVLKWVKENCKYMFFQTAHAKSRGMYLIKDFQTVGDIGEHLGSFGFTILEVGVSQIHGGGDRGLFLCQS